MRLTAQSRLSTAGSLADPLCSRGDGSRACSDAGSEEHNAATPPRAGSNTTAAIAWTIANLITSILIVFVNKLAFVRYNFKFPLTLCTIHTLVSVLGLQLLARCPSILEVKPIPLKSKLYMGTCYAGFVSTGILSIQLNPVGIYQITRNVTTPCVVLIELLLYRKFPSARIIASVLILLTGVTMCTVVDYGVGATSLLGITVAMASTMVSAWQQVLASSMQRELDVNGMQLLHQSTPAAALLMLLVVPFIDDISLLHPSPTSLLLYNMTLPAGLIIFGSAVLGLTVMLSAFQMIGLTSALSYNVIGYSKTIIIVSGGWLLFGEQMCLLKGLGVALAIAGVGGYSLSKFQEGRLSQIGVLKNPL
jgi:solute carrier family 35 protein E3